MADIQTLLALKNINKHYDSPDGSVTTPVLTDININIEAGESIAIIGPSGSGKSTLLNIMGALDRPSSGKVYLDGKDLSTASDKELSKIRNREIGFIFQLHHLLPQLTVLENILIPTLPFSTGDINNYQKNAIELLKKVGLGERIYYMPGHLSGGERQRTAVVRALINQPKILLADEPTGSLDRESALQLVELLVSLNKEDNLTLVMVTHSIELARYMKKIMSLKDGRLTPKGRLENNN